MFSEIHFLSQIFMSGLFLPDSGLFFDPQGFQAIFSLFWPKFWVVGQLHREKFKKRDFHLYSNERTFVSFHYFFMRVCAFFKSGSKEFFSSWGFFSIFCVFRPVKCLHVSKKFCIEICGPEIAKNAQKFGFSKSLRNISFYFFNMGVGAFERSNNNL